MLFGSLLYASRNLCQCLRRSPPQPQGDFEFLLVPLPSPTQFRLPPAQPLQFLVNQAVSLRRVTGAIDSLIGEQVEIKLGKVIDRPMATLFQQGGDRSYCRMAR